MSCAWETTLDDVRTVVDAHAVTLSEEQLQEFYDDLDCEEIEDNLLHFTNMDDQAASMLEDIERALIAAKILPTNGVLKFSMTDRDLAGDDDDEDEDEDE